MTIEEELHINCPPATAFDLMADLRNMTRWNEGVSKADLMSDEPIGKGSRFIVVNRGQELESTITAFDSPGRLVFDTTSKSMDAAGSFTFQESGEGTTFTIVIEPRPKGLMSLLVPLLSPIIRRDLAKQHYRFKEFCETQA